MKRLFVAILLEKEVIKVLSKFRDGLGRQTSYLRWTIPKNLHVTLLFIGDVDEAYIPDTIYAIDRIACDSAPFELEFGRAIYAPPNRPSSMVWLRLKESTEFSGLALKLSRAVKELALKYPDAFPDFINLPLKHLNPHITLARFDRKARIPRTLTPLKRIGIEHSQMNADRCVLMESRLTPSGPIFTELETFIFNG